MGALYDAVSDFLRAGLCGILDARDAIAAIAGIGEGDPITGIDYAGYIRGQVCGIEPQDPATQDLPPSNLFDQGPGWYVFTKGRFIDEFTCTRGPDDPQYRREFFSNSYVSVARTTDKRRQNGPCQWTFGAFLALTRADGTVQEGSADNPFGVVGELTSLEIIRWGGGSNYQPRRGALPGDWNRVSGDITIPGPGGGPGITVPIVGVFAPVQIDINGSVTIPVKVDVGGVTINFTYDASRDSFYSSPTGGGQDSRPGNQPSDLVDLPSNPAPPPPGGVVGPPSGPGSPDNPQGDLVVVAALVTVDSVDDSASVIYQDNNPDVYVPDLGLVQFCCRVGKSGWAWTVDERIKNRRQLVVCPSPWGAISVAGTPRVGVNWTLTPLYSKKREPLPTT